MRPILWANEVLLDHLIVSSDGEHVGMVDDLELSDGAQPRVTALLSGPTAFGARLGGRPGIWWLAIGRRLRPDSDPYPNRIPIDDLKEVDHRGLTLRVRASEVPSRRLFDWALEKVIVRIPGNGSS
jgi:sporulation protein YlmC with PRC-barrel domain